MGPLHKSFLLSFLGRHCHMFVGLVVFNEKTIGFFFTWLGLKRKREKEAGFGNVKVSFSGPQV